MTGNDDELFQEKYARLVESFVASLPVRLQKIRQHWQSLLTDWTQPGIQQEMHREVHSLAGAGATFGYDMVTTHARELEELLAGLDHNQPPSAEEKEQIERLLERLAHAALGRQS
jgi:HPt (histidine-containing phosphotransfer) domain-containing protein